MCTLGINNRWPIFIALLTSVKVFSEIGATPVKRSDNSQEVIVKQVPFGDTVTLECRSNDKDHNFLYWHINEKNTLVGPTNEQKFDHLKFKYEVLSGNLTIRAVSENEEGLYNCVSRGVRRDDFNVRSVRMIIKKDWEEVYEEDPGVNTFRVVIVITSLVVLSGVGYLAYRVWRNRYRHPSYLVPSEDEEEDSGDEIFTAPGTSRPTTGNIVNTHSTEGFDEPGISTDFKSILDTANSK